MVISQNAKFNNEKSWLKSLGLKGPVLKLGVEKSGVEMSFNHHVKFVFDFLTGNSTRVCTLIFCQ